MCLDSPWCANLESRDDKILNHLVLEKMFPTGCQQRSSNIRLFQFVNVSIIVLFCASSTMIIYAYLFFIMTKALSFEHRYADWLLIFDGPSAIGGTHDKSRF